VRKIVFLFYVGLLLFNILIVVGSVKPDFRLVVLLQFLSLAGLVLLSYWVWRDGEQLEK
jgi:hypothetical protein